MAIWPRAQLARKQTHLRKRASGDEWLEAARWMIGMTMPVQRRLREKEPSSREAWAKRTQVRHESKVRPQQCAPTLVGTFMLSASSLHISKAAKTHIPWC